MRKKNQKFILNYLMNISLWTATPVKKAKNGNFYLIFIPFLLVLNTQFNELFTDPELIATPFSSYLSYFSLVQKKEKENFLFALIIKNGRKLVTVSGLGKMFGLMDDFLEGNFKFASIL